MHGINIGTFYSGSSFMHGLAAQTKIVSLLFFIAAEVCTQNIMGFVILSIPVFFSIVLKDGSYASEKFVNQKHHSDFRGVQLDFGFGFRLLHER